MNGEETAVNGQMEGASETTVETTTGAMAGAEQTTQSESLNSSEEKSNTQDTEGDGTEALVEKTVPYSRFSEVYERMKAAEEKASMVGQQTQYAEPIAQDEVQVKSALEKLGYVGTDKVQDMIKSAIAEDRVYREMDTKVQQLSKEWDGKDGKPAFNIEEVAEYAQKTGIYDPEAAFKQMYQKPLIEYYAKQARTSIKTERQGKPIQDVGSDYGAMKEEAVKSGDFAKLIQMKLNR